MSETPKFTPGPWAWNGPPENIHVTQAADPDMRVCFMTSNGPTEANASLIAAAPELYATLKRARDMLQAVAGDIEDGGSLDSLRGKYVLAILGVRDAAYDALANAEGLK